MDTERPALADAVSRPDIVRVLGELVHHGFLGGGQLDVTQVQWSRLIAAGQLVAAQTGCEGHDRELSSCPTASQTYIKEPIAESLFINTRRSRPLCL